MVFFGGLDEDRVDVDADDVVSDLGEVPAHASRTTPGVEDAGPARRHRVDEPSLADQVVTLAREIPQWTFAAEMKARAAGEESPESPGAFDLPARVVGILGDLLHGRTAVPGTGRGIVDNLRAVSGAESTQRHRAIRLTVVEGTGGSREQVGTLRAWRTIPAARPPANASGSA
jgi:hypothetical protein